MRILGPCVCGVWHGTSVGDTISESFLSVGVDGGGVLSHWAHWVPSLGVMPQPTDLDVQQDGAEVEGRLEGRVVHALRPVMFGGHFRGFGPGDRINRRRRVL